MVWDLTTGSNFTERFNREMVSKFILESNGLVETLLISNTAYVEWFRAQNVWLESFSAYLTAFLAPVNWRKAPLLNYGKIETNERKKAQVDMRVSFGLILQPGRKK